MSDLIHESIVESAKRFPNKDAFRCNGKGLSYSELASRSSQFARTLADQGVQPGDRVGIYMNKRIELPIAVYGILKAGAAYVPIDPSAPVERVQFIAENCGIRKLVSGNHKKRQIKALAALPSPIDTILGMEPLEFAPSIAFFPWERIFENQDRQFQVAVEAEDLAYIMYTSGSTGSPKGLMHTHRSGLCYAKCAAETYGIVNTDILGNHSSLHFDMSTLEFFAGPYRGSTSVLIPEETTMFPVSMAQLIEDEAFTFWYSVPLALIQLINSGNIEERNLDSLRWVLFGGEPFPPKYLRKLMDRLPDARFSNVYGPAEVNQCTYYHVPADLSPDIDSLPIGQVWSAAKGLVVDENDDEAPEGETGELLIESGTMMSAYWKRDDLNQKSFYRDNDSNVYYRTGDLVRYSPTGELMFLGRKDRQIKVRGYRMELDEVENVFNAIEQVEEAAAVAIRDSEGNNDIYAAITVKKGHTIDEQTLRRIASRKLPIFGVPRVIRICERFSRTMSGKIDRKKVAARFQEGNASPAKP